MTRLRLPGAALALLCWLSAVPAHAQEPTRPVVPDTMAVDTTLADTARAAQDTAAQDSLAPPPGFHAIFARPTAAVAGTGYYWDRDALALEAAVSLADLLDQVPGMISLRAGLFQQPEAVSVFGQTRGRVEVVMDGYVLDPFTTATFDIGELELSQVEELRIERRLDLTRIHITTLEARDRTPYSRIEAATGEPNGNLFRGVFAAPYVIAGPLALALDRFDSDGRGGQEEADIFGIWGKWSMFGGGGARALQLEVRQSRLRRLEGVPWTADLDRRDLVLRARSRLFEGMAAELFAGMSSMSRAPVDTSASDSLRAVTLERDALQYGARANFRRGPAWLDAEARLRNSDALPSRQFDVSGGLEVGTLVRLAASLTSAAWSQGEGASSFDVRAEAGPFMGLGAFAELAGGKRGAPLYADSLGHGLLEAHTVNERSGSRLGVFARLRGIDVNAALVKLEADSAESFGLPFDSGFPRSIIEDASGYEVFGRVPLWPRGMSVTGSFTYWQDAIGWLYLPARSWRVAAELHTLPLQSRNLEILGRIEHQRREAMLVPEPDFDPADPESNRYRTMLPRNLLNGYLQIRVIDVRAFIHWYDLLGDFREDVPGRVVRGPRILYGVKWQLFN